MEQFIKLVKRMRQAQREYFSSRNASTLTKAKSLEREVDSEIKRLTDSQLNLFKNERRSKENVD